MADRKKPDAKPDPAQDPEFQRVVKHFLATPPEPHKKPDGDKKRKAAIGAKRQRRVKS